MKKSRGPRNKDRIVYYRLSASEYAALCRIAADESRTVSNLTRLAIVTLIESRTAKTA